MTSIDAVRDQTVEALQALLGALRVDVGAGRTTVRLDDCGFGFHVDTVAAESLAEGVHSIKTHNALDQKNAAAVKWLEKNRRTFVMSDTLNPWDASVAPEQEVIETYGIRSEMVAPVFMSEDLVGWVSVHYTKGAREWTAAEIARLESACADVADLVRAALSRLS